jgi:predicted metal-dependent peptidase
MATAALNKFSACRLKAATTWPYAAPAILATTVVERPGCGNIVADKFWRLYFDPKTIEEWTHAQIVGKILFEISHLLRSHAKRFSRQLGFDPNKMKPRPDAVEFKRKVWCEAASLELVDDFEEENLALPESIKKHEDWGVPTKLLAEHYYNRLQRAQEGQPQSGGGGKSKKQKGQAGHGKSKGQKSEEQEDGEGGGQGEKPPEFPIDGSAADGVQKPWEEPQPADDDHPEDPNDPCSDIPGLSENDAEMLRREVAKRTHEHAKNRGRVPNGMRRWADEVHQPKLDYRRIILQKVTRAVQIVKGNKDFSYKRPGRRSPSNTVLNPSLIDHQVNVAVVIDTSGSMSSKQLGEAVKIVAGVLKALPRREAVRVMAADAAVYAVQKVFNEARIELQGGGGTEMGLAIKTASMVKPKPDLVLCLTDGYTDWPSEPTNGVPCVAIIVSDGRKTAPAWIDQVCVPYVVEENAENEEEEDE